MCALHAKPQVMKEFIVHENQTAYVRWRLYLQMFGYWDFSVPKIENASNHHKTETIEKCVQSSFWYKVIKYVNFNCTCKLLYQKDSFLQAASW